jgi:hypothetical protein
MGTLLTFSNQIESSSGQRQSAQEIAVSRFDGWIKRLVSWN